MSIQNIELPILNEQATDRSAAPSARLQALSGVQTQLTVVAGRAHSRVGDLLALQEGAVLTLDRPLNADFDVLLGEHIIARGALVAVGDSFGILISELAPDEGQT